MEDIEKELEEKSIERSVDVFDNGVLIIDKEEEPAPAAERPPELVIEPVDEIKEETPKQVEVVKKSKKVRSQKQIEAFEKARKKRAEILAEKKKNKEAEKEQKKEEKKALKKGLPPPVATRDVDLIKPMSQGAPPAPNPDKGRDQVIQNHYYYYGVPPPSDHHATPKRKKKKSKRPPTPSSSESESSDEEEEVERIPHQRQQQQYYEVPKPQYKFSYA